MTDTQQREAARQFFYRWKDKGKEDEDARSYWIKLLSNVYGVERVTGRVEFEKKVAGDKSKKRIDIYIPETHALICARLDAFTKPSDETKKCCFL